MNPRETSEIVGAGLLCVGVAIRYGTSAALITLGALLLTFSVYGRLRKPRPVKPPEPSPHMPEL